jgi:hypothetical protein
MTQIKPMQGNKRLLFELRHLHLSAAKFFWFVVSVHILFIRGKKSSKG